MPGHRRARRALIALLLAAAGLAAGAAPSHAAAKWVVGTGEYQYGYSCVGMDSYYTTQTRSYAMYWADAEAGYPAVGDRYYMQLQIGQLGSTCPYGIADNATELILPANTQLAIYPTATDKNDRGVRCFHIGSDGKETDVTNMTWTAVWDSSIKGKWCDASKVPSRGTYGPHLGQRLLSQGTQFVVRVPVMSTKRLAGMGAPGDTAKMAGAISSGVNTFAVPFQYVTVFDRAATVAYPATATTNVGTATATTSGVVNSWYRKGSIYVDLGTAASGTYTTTAGPFAVDGTYPQYTIKQDWASLIAGTDYRWRVRFVDESGATTSGAAQAFRTTGTAPAPGGGGTPSGPQPGGGSTGGGSTGGGSTGGGSQPPEEPKTGDDPVVQQPAGPAAPGAPAAVTPVPAPRSASQVAPPSPKAPTAPVFTLARGARLGALAKGVPVTVTCAGACTARATLKVDAKTAKTLGLGAKPVTLATGTRTAAKAGRVAIRLKASRRVATKLRRARAVTASLTVSVTGGASATSKVTLKR